MPTKSNKNNKEKKNSPKHTRNDELKSQSPKEPARSGLTEKIEKNRFTILIGLNFILALLVIILLFRLAGSGSSQANNPSKTQRDEKTGETFYHKNEVKNTITKNIGTIAPCYDTFLKTNPKTKEGTVKIDWSITPDGDTQRVEVVSSELGQNPTDEKAALALVDCTISSIKTWQFPEPPDGEKVYVAHKFYFGNPKPRQAPEMVNLQ